MDINVTSLSSPIEQRDNETLSQLVLSAREKVDNEVLPQLVLSARENIRLDQIKEEKVDDNDDIISDTDSNVDRQSLPDIRLPSSPEVIYGLMPRMSWMYRLMERAGVSSRSARAMSWYENDKDAYQHHADYLKRLSKLREELIQQEQSNLANALDRLRMRSYGREFVYSRPVPEKKDKSRYSANSETISQRKSLLTTFERFQRMRPKKKAPSIMPLEGKSLIDTPTTDRSERHERQERHERHTAHTDRDTGATSSVDESVRLNLQRLGGHTMPSIPRQRRNQHRDIYVESSSYRSRYSNNESNNANLSEDRVAKMQKVNQKMMKLRHEAREADRAKLAPDSFRVSMNDEDRMNLDKLKEYYCVYYIPTTSPTSETSSFQLPMIGSAGPEGHVTTRSSVGDKSGKSYKNGKTGYKVTSDIPIPPTVCNCACRMYVSGNKLHSSMDQIDFSIQKTQSVNDPHVHGAHRKNGYVTAKAHSFDSFISDISSSQESNDKNRTSPEHSERVKIRVDMPSIVYSDTPEPNTTTDNNSGLVKAFKQKELRQKELSNLIEDVKEINKQTETLTGSGI